MSHLIMHLLGRMSALVPLMIVPLLVWGAVWFYMWNLDGRVKRLEEQNRLDESGEGRD